VSGVVHMSLKEQAQQLAREIEQDRQKAEKMNPLMAAGVIKRMAAKQSTLNTILVGAMHG